MTDDERPPETTTPPPRPAPPERPKRALRSTLAVFAAGVLLVLGLLISFIAFLSLSQPGRPELGPVYAMTALIMQGSLLLIGVLNIGAALGIYLHIGWARRLGLALAVLGLGASVVFFVGPLTNFQMSVLDPLVIATTVAILGYGYCVLALLVAGSHFAPRPR